jgi:hypothetical protein
MKLTIAILATLALLWILRWRWDGRAERRYRARRREKP